MALDCMKGVWRQGMWVLLPAAVFSVFAQNELWVKVTFYDYRADGTNPNFQACNPGHKSGMVQDHLSADHKPLLRANLACNDRVESWYRPSGAGPEAVYDDSTHRWSGLVPYNGRPDEWVGQSWNAADPMANIVIYDSLRFVSVAGQPSPRGGVYPPGTFQYDNQSFFGVDGRGFGEQPVNSGHNFGFTMELHRTFQYNGGEFFDFKGDDDVWVFINGRLALDIGGVHGSISRGFALDELAGQLGIEKGNSYPLDFFYAERHTWASTIRITSNIITSVPDTLYIRASSDRIRAGEVATLDAIIEDQNDSLRTDLAELVEWNIVPSSKEPGDSLFNLVGSSTRFTGTVAHRAARITATYRDPDDPGSFLTAEATVYIDPGPPSKIVIERASDGPLDSATVVGGIDLNRAGPQGIITMSESETLKYAQAVARDQYDNFVRLAVNASWSSARPNLATTAVAPGRSWESALNRVPGAKGDVVITASEPGLTPGTVTLQIRDAVIDSLILVYADDPSGTPIDTVRMNTDQDTTIKVLGVWSDNPGVWVDVTGLWSLNPDTLRSAAPLPGSEANQWNYSPINPGGADLTVTSGGKSVTVPMRIVPAPPSVVTLEVITPGDSLIAGRPFKVRVTVENTDGPVPGQWCGSAVYHDTLGTGGRPRPYVMINGEWVPLDQAGTECFQDGYDTVDVTLYHAPFNYVDSLHRISVTLDGRLEGSTKPFRLWPGDLDSMVLEDDAGKAYVDTIRLVHPDGAVMIYATGYDEFGNKIGVVKSLWDRSGTLHDIGMDSTGQVYYGAEAVTGSEMGTITATALENPAVSAHADVRIIGPGARIVAASTRDTSGNGYLDAIDITYSKAVAFPAGYDVLNNVRIEWRGRFLVVDSITSMSGAQSDSLFRIHIREDTTRGEPETAWTPLLSMTGVPEAEDASGFVVSDGAPPVIWTVEKYSGSAGDRTKDRVVVTFSETILQPNGNPFSLTTHPPLVFFVWTQDSAGTYVQRPEVLEGIMQFAEKRDNKLVFYMTNGRELNGEHHLSIQYAVPPLGDEVRNTPAPNNRKVRVVVRGAVGSLVVGPNPFSPNFFIPSREGGGSGAQTQLVSHPATEVYGWIRDPQKGGVAIKVVDFVLAEDRSAPARAWLMVFDAVGNLVHKRSTEDAIPHDLWDSDWVAGTNRELVFYWNGITDRETRSAPGIYKMVVYIEYAGQRQQYRKNVGIAR